MSQRSKSELTKDLILTESFKLFYKNGYKATSVDKIMQTTSLTKGAFYHHYKNKKELGLAIIRNRLHKRVYERMVLPLFTDGDALAIIRNTFNSAMNSFTDFEKEHGCALNNFINEIADQEIEYQFALRSIIEEWKSALVHIIERGKSEKSIRKEVESNSTATYLISSFEGIRGIRKLYKDDKILQEYLNGLTSYINQLAIL